jgi:hypothetical protein
MEEAILSQMKAAIKMEDDLFKSHLDKLISVARGSNVAISDTLKRRSIALLVSRYARCSDKPEHGALRDGAVAVIGNPWVKKNEWDAHVKCENGQPNEEAREMINSWLKRKLISDFFDVLTEDGAVDQRRRDYWLRFEPVIKDVWLALGPRAGDDPNYEKLRARADGRWLHLENPGSAENNAFIMWLGDWVIVEFGMKGNACYIYKFPPFKFSSLGKISLNNLKNQGAGDRFIHRDAKTIAWEEKLDDKICPLIDYWPDRDKKMPRSNTRVNQPSSGLPVPRPTPHSVPITIFDEEEFWAIVEENGLTTNDDRSKGGALWVPGSRYFTQLPPDIEQKLETWGFKYKPGRGWWRE